MSRTITIRITDELDEWLEDTARRTKIKKGRIIRSELEKARTSQRRAFMRLAGSVSGPADLSSRKGFSES
jgi:predicted transcriptional regulator